MSDHADLLFEPLLSGEVAPESDRGFWLNAQAVPPPPGGRFTIAIDQRHRGLYDACLAAGYPPIDDLRAPFGFGLVWLGKQRRFNHGEIARGLSLLAPGGPLIVGGENEIGAARYEKELAGLLPLAGRFHRRRCRFFWVARPADLPAGFAEWAADAAPRAIADGRFQSVPGAFSWDRIDTGSALLADSLPDDLAGHVADLGAGWGYLSAELAARHPAVTAIDLVEVDRAALDMARRNLAGLRADLTVTCHWCDATRGLPAGAFDAVVCNPPFHEGHETDIDLGRAFIAAAAGALRPRGVLYLVANRTLPYEEPLKRLFKSVERIADRSGFKVLRAVKAA